MLAKKYLLLLVCSVFLTGCCCVASDLEESYSFSLCSTFDASCEKSCSTLGSEYAYEGMEFDLDECVSDCRGVLESEGFDPDSCCPEEYTVGYLCEYECSDPENPYGPNCIDSCVNQIGGMMGLDADDCIVPV